MRSTKNCLLIETRKQIDLFCLFDETSQCSYVSRWTKPAIKYQFCEVSECRYKLTHKIQSNIAYNVETILYLKMKKTVSPNVIELIYCSAKGVIRNARGLVQSSSIVINGTLKPSSSVGISVFCVMIDLYRGSTYVDPP